MATATTNAIERSDRRYIAASMQAPMLEREEEAGLARRWLGERDEAALHKLIEAHARLVVRIAAGFRRSGLPMGDLVQEGNIGLMDAADRFDPERGVRFSTYASWWVVAAIQNYILRNTSIVRAATTPKQRRLFFNLRRLTAKHSTGPDGRLTDDDRVRIAELLDVKVADVQRMEAHLSRPDRSLDAHVGEDDSLSQIDLLPDTGPSPEEIAGDASAAAARRAWVEQALADLSPRERSIITSRFLGEERTTLAEIGTRYGVSKERIRQIEGRAITKMRATLASVAGKSTEIYNDI